jgi:hypothetical protein
MPKLFIGLVGVTGEPVKWASAHLHCAINCCSLILVEKKQTLHAPTSTPQGLVHGVMLGVWRKIPLPHHNRQRKTLQKQNTTCPKSCLVAAVKVPHPHKEKKQFAIEGRGLSSREGLSWSNNGLHVDFLFCLRILPQPACNLWQMQKPKQSRPQSPPEDDE